MAFDTRDRFPENEERGKKWSKKTAEEIKGKVKEMKERRIRIKILKDMEEKEKFEKEREQLKRIHQRLR
jgi:hypothetical protein